MFVTLIYRHAEISTGPSQHFIFNIRHYAGVERGTVGFSALQRKWATILIGQVGLVIRFSVTAHMLLPTQIELLRKCLL